MIFRAPHASTKPAGTQFRAGGTCQTRQVAVEFRFIDHAGQRRRRAILQASSRRRDRPNAVNAVQDRPGRQSKTPKSLFPDHAGTDRVIPDPLLGIEHRDTQARRSESISRIQPRRPRSDHSYIAHQHRVTSRPVRFLSSFSSYDLIAGRTHRWRAQGGISRAGAAMRELPDSVLFRPCPACLDELF